MKNERGLTLVELMIVVAIIGILAGIASIAYSRYIKSAKIEQLRQYALELASGQERFRSRNNVYWNGGVLSGATKDDYANLIDFDKFDTLPPLTTVAVEAWDGSGPGCTICQGVGFDATNAGFAVVVTRDLNENEANNTTIVTTNTAQNPVLLYEGQ